MSNVYLLHQCNMTVLIYFLDSLAAPLFLSSSLRQDRNKVIHRFVFLVQHIYCEVWLGWSRRVSFSRFPTHDLPFIPYISLLFFIASFSSCGHFVSLELSPSSLSFPPFSSKFFLWALPFPLFSSFHGRFFLG